MSADIPNNYSKQTVQLNNGIHMPIIGLGTWKSESQQVKNAVLTAVKAGYRHIDTAAMYRNEPEVGEAIEELIRDKVVERKDLFITSKLWNTHHDNVREACLKTLKDLKLDYLDLYLIHWPMPLRNGGLDLSGGDTGYEAMNDSNELIKVPLAKVPLHKTWPEMEKLVDDGLVKSIGVSNFNIQSLLDLWTYARILPAINQVEVHPYLNRYELIRFAKLLGNITTTAYSPFGSGLEGNALNDDTIAAIAKKHNKDPSHIILRWSIQRGVVVIPKSVHDERIKSNFEVFDFELSPHEMEKIDNLNQNKRIVQVKGAFGFDIFA